MADEFQSSGNWWDSSSRNRFESGTPPSSSALFGWSTDMTDNLKSSRSTMDSVSVSATSSLVNLHISDSADPNLHMMMGLGPSSQPMDWHNQPLFNRGDQKGPESSFRSMLQENMNSNANFHEHETSTGQLQWRDKLFPGDSSTNVRGFSLDQTQFSPQYSSGDSTVTSQGLQSNTNFQMDSPANLYGTSPSTNILQGLFGTSTHDLNTQHQSSSMNFPYPQNYGVNNEILPSNWSNKVPQFLRNSPPKHQQHPSNNYSHLHFSNNAPFWNAASSESSIKDVKPAFFPNSHLQPQFVAQPFDEKPKKNIISQVRESGSVVKKSGSESASKRPRNESSPSALPAFKVRKEKMGDRITALQQLVSPFGKTDTASVLSEAIEYIKFLHEQVSVLSNPYMKSGAAMQHQQINSEKSKEQEGPKQDLRSRGLCLVPVSSTFPVTHETTVDFWTPTFGGTFR